MGDTKNDPQRVGQNTLCCGYQNGKRILIYGTWSPGREDDGDFVHGDNSTLQSSAFTTTLALTIQHQGPAGSVLKSAADLTTQVRGHSWSLKTCALCGKKIKHSLQTQNEPVQLGPDTHSKLLIINY